MYDLIILGGGPAGYAAAIVAGRQGKKTLLFEGQRVGGTCLNVGCIPTKYLLDKGGFLCRLRGLTGAGILKEAGRFSYSRIAKGKDAVVKKLTDGVAGLLHRHGVETVAAFAELAAPGLVKADGKEYRARNILIATGSEPSVPPIPGVEHTVNSTDLLAMTKPPRRLIVIGGGVIGVELATAMRAFGSEVTVVEMLPGLFPGEEPEMVKAVAAGLTKAGIDVVTNARVTGIAAHAGGKRVAWEKDGSRSEREADIVLLASGRKPRLTGIDAAKLGLVLARGAVAVDQYMRTNLPAVYAAGDAAGGWQLAHAAYAEAEGAVANMFGEERPVDLSVMPRCVYTMPPFAAVGATTAELDRKGIGYNVGRFPYAACGMALAEDATEGAAMVLSGKESGTILGAHIVGEAAHELISIAALAVAARLTVHQWERVITPHPSLAEILPEAALAGIGLARHI